MARGAAGRGAPSRARRPGGPTLGARSIGVVPGSRAPYGVPLHGVAICPWQAVTESSRCNKCLVTNRCAWRQVNGVSYRRPPDTETSMRPVITLCLVSAFLFADCTPGAEPAEQFDMHDAGGAEARPGFATSGLAVQQRAAHLAADPVKIRPTPEASGMVIRTGQTSIEVDSLERAVAQVGRLAGRVGGYVANTTLQTGRGQLRAASLEVKFPADRFDDGLGGLAGLGKLESVNVTAEDVGEEFTDVTARMGNARRLEARLIDLLATRTGKLKDVLDVEQELARVRE